MTHTPYREAGLDREAVARNNALRDAAAIAMTHAIKAGGAEGRARRAAATDGSISGQQVEIEEAVGFSKMARTAHTIAKQILSCIPGSVSDPALAPIDGEQDVMAHAAEWLRHLRSDEPLMRHTAADNLERIIERLALTSPTSEDAGEVATSRSPVSEERVANWAHEIASSVFLTTRFNCAAAVEDARELVKHSGYLKDHPEFAKHIDRLLEGASVKVCEVLLGQAQIDRVATILNDVLTLSNTQPK